MRTLRTERVDLDPTKFYGTLQGNTAITYLLLHLGEWDPSPPGSDPIKPYVPFYTLPEHDLWQPLPHGINQIYWNSREDAEIGFVDLFIKLRHGQYKIYGRVAQDPELELISV
ncbi:MAG: hypothetical protein HYW24_00250 [Candidatus Aenigmarchaeota archaeon]|nr:hypothetical protein [Candidatus Aenigmarchaeota archaeon]